MSKKISIKPWKVAVEDENYGVRGHKLFAILSFVRFHVVVSYTDLNKFAYNYTRRGEKSRWFTGKKYDKKENRGYIGCHLHSRYGYIRHCLNKIGYGEYCLNAYGLKKLAQLEVKFGYKLVDKYIRNYYR
jgi:hypothetical protein